MVLALDCDPTSMRAICSANVAPYDVGSPAVQMDLEELVWSDELKDVFRKLTNQQLPSFRACNLSFGTLVKTISKDRPSLCIIDDKYAALVGKRCMQPGDSKATYEISAVMVIKLLCGPFHKAEKADQRRTG